MTYTVRFAHLLERPPLMVGAVVKHGDKVGTMGSSGQSTAPHVHADCVDGAISRAYTLAEIEAGDPKPSPRQMNHFIDKDLFSIDPFITTYYADPEYQRTLKKVHHGYDLVPVDRHKTKAHHGIKWNRSFPGRVVRVGFDPKGYGHHIQIAFDAPAPGEGDPA
jgi:murein DD-endopeptidase MepM/ murein hydrolase activator NlpD